MEVNENKNRVQEWFENGCNFDKGVALLAEIGKNKNIIKVITGREITYADKLRYELLKAAGITDFDNVKTILHHASLEENISFPVSKVTASKTKTKSIEDDLPKPVREVIKEHSRLFRERSIASDERSELGDSNTEAVVEERKRLTELIADYSDKIELLWEAKEAFYNQGIIPNLESLLKGESSEKVTKVLTLPDDKEALDKMKKNLQSANVKSKNQLEFQMDKKGDKPNPIKEGPKRLKIELKIKSRELEIEAIDNKLIEIANPNA